MIENTWNFRYHIAYYLPFSEADIERLNMLVIKRHLFSVGITAYMLVDSSFHPPKKCGWKSYSGGCTHHACIYLISDMFIGTKHVFHA